MYQRNTPPHGRSQSRPPFRGGRKPFAHRSDDDRSSSEGGDRERSSSYGDRPRSSSDRPSRAPSRPSYGDRPRSSFGSRPGGSSGSYGPRKSFGDRSERPSYGDRPRRPFGDRPSYGDRPRPSFGDRPSYGDRPRSQSYGDRPRPAYGEQSDRPARRFERGANSDRPSFGDRPRPSYGDRPRPSYGDRQDRPSYGDRPRSFGDRGARSFGDRNDRPERKFDDDRFAKRPEGAASNETRRFGEQPKRYESNPKPLDAKDTSWEPVADWYDNMLETDEDSYQAQVVGPNLLRMMRISQTDRIVDLGCGQGFFSRLFALQGAKVTGVDASPELIAKAQEHTGSANIRFLTEPAQMTSLQDGCADVITIVLALQNMEDMRAVFRECTRLLTPRGRIYLVLNHPAFRIPQSSDWIFDAKTQIQSRRVAQYLSQAKIKIDMTPGKTEHKIFTWSFHHSLQSYVNQLFQAGFVTCRMEEWASHKESQPGPRARAEDQARKEIPLFLCIEARKLSSFYVSEDAGAVEEAKEETPEVKAAE